MNQIDALFIAFIVTIIGGFFVVWKLLDDVSDIVKLLGNVVNFFTSSQSRMKQSQRFNLAVDIVMLIGILSFAFLFMGSQKDIFTSFLIFVFFAFVCYLVSVFKR